MSVTECELAVSWYLGVAVLARALSGRHGVHFQVSRKFSTRLGTNKQLGSVSRAFHSHINI